MDSPVLTSFQGPHRACRNAAYPRTEGAVARGPVGDGEVDWAKSAPAYAPTEYTSPTIVGAPWADKGLSEDKFAWNAVDGKVSRKSFTGPYEIESSGRPRNPMGRTGLSGRGTLGKWGPNHAADPIVSRWKRGADGAPVLHPKSGRPVLEFVSIERRDCGQWAIPGGMVDAGECVSATLRREFGEETLSSLELGQAEKERLEADMEAFFKEGRVIYRGYVDDPRNTDNAWMETVAVNFHDADGQKAGRFNLKAGDDAANVQWMAVDGAIQLYASHKQFIEAVCSLHKAHW